MSATYWSTLNWTRAQLDAATQRFAELGLQIDYATLANRRPDLALARYLWEEREDLRVLDESLWPSAPKWRVPPGWPLGGPWPTGCRLYYLKGLDTWLAVVDWGLHPDTDNPNPDRHAIMVEHHLGVSRQEWTLLLQPVLAESLIASPVVEGLRASS